MATLASASSDYEREHSPLKKLKTQNRVDLHEIPMVCDRYRVSDCAGASVATAPLKAYEIVSGSLKMS